MILREKDYTGKSYTSAVIREVVIPSNIIHACSDGDIAYILLSTYTITKVDLVTGVLSTIPIDRGGLTSKVTTICAYANKIIANLGTVLRSYDIATQAWSTLYHIIGTKYISQTAHISNMLFLFYIGSDKADIIYTESTAVDVSQLKGTSENINAYEGVDAQLIVNSDDHTLHIMDGVKKGGYKLATTDMSNFYNKTEVDALLDTKADKAATDPIITRLDALEAENVVLKETIAAQQVTINNLAATRLKLSLPPAK